MPKVEELDLDLKTIARNFISVNPQPADLIILANCDYILRNYFVMLMKLCSFCASYGRHLCHVLLVPPITKHFTTPLWHLCQTLLRHFWNRWSSEYLASWRKKQENDTCCMNPGKIVYFSILHFATVCNSESNLMIASKV